MEASGEGELSKGEEMQVGTGCGEEKILVLVRLRPLSEKEIAQSEVCDWECINETTILFRNSLQERSMFPAAHTFDRVFGEDSPTRQLYDEGVKDIALSVVNGINSSIFAYGQTSSGKTYTMVGVTEYSVAEIYDYIERHEDRVFSLKFSAMEIYNEAIRDLLTTDNCLPLRILDDPERGTMVENLTEETLRDRDHLMKLLSICEAQRKTGETSLNETSSRSHQILRLTVESSARDSLGKGNSARLAASVNFVDLAGSERASQALSVGTRLKEGCHINRSLLTLGTVVRKLSKGKHGHVNYRDSKLTRILQPCLGGNARTAIICTLSPARSHAEQSRNTLLFASCAKEVSTNAKVNVVMSDKALVKHLQRELARLESELRNPAVSYTCDHTELLGEKDLQIKLLENQVSELTMQRDLAESRVLELTKQRGDFSESQVEDFLRMVGDDQPSRELEGLRNRLKWQKPKNWEDGSLVSEFSGMEETHYLYGGSRRPGTAQPFNRDQEDSKFQVVTAEDPDDIKEVRCIEMDESSQEQKSGPISLSDDYAERMLPLTMPSYSFGRHEGKESTIRKETSDFQRDVSFGRKDQNLYLHDPSPRSQACTTPDSRHELLNRRWSCRDSFKRDAPPYTGEDRSLGEAMPPSCFEKNFPEGLQKMLPQINYDDAKLSRSNSQHSVGSVSLDEVKSQRNTNLDDENIPTFNSFITGLKEMAKVEYNKKLADSEVTDLKAENDRKDGDLDTLQDALQTPASWSVEFASRQKSIIELWKFCNTSLIHRTYFFLLFGGDPTDSIYMEVEQRRLSFLKEAFSQGSHAVASGQTLTLASSLKALQREREMLSRLMSKRYTVEERNEMYGRWGVRLGSKRRRMQLIKRLWNDTNDMNQVRDSAAIVGKLIRFPEQGGGLKEMFGLSFTVPQTTRRSFGWKRSIPFVL